MQGPATEAIHLGLNQPPVFSLGVSTASYICKKLLCTYQHYASLPPYWTVDGIARVHDDIIFITMKMTSSCVLAEESAPIVRNLITSECIVKHCICQIPSNLPSFSRGFDYRVCPTIRAIDV